MGVLNALLHLLTTMWLVLLALVLAVVVVGLAAAVWAYALWQADLTRDSEEE